MGARIFGGLIALVVAVLVVPAPAWAHNSLTGSNPKDGQRVARPPATVRLTFLSRLTPKATKVRVTGPDGASVVAGAPTFARNRVTVRLSPGPAGRYTVSYELPSDDGHPIKGKVVFTASEGSLAAAATPPPATPTPSPSPSSTPPSVAVSPVAAPAGDDGEGDSGAWWFIGGALAAAALLAGGILLMRRRAAAAP